jgi:hypothetical protein
MSSLLYPDGKSPKTYWLFFLILLYYALIYAYVSPLVSLGLLAKILYAFFIAFMNAVCLTYFTLHVIIQTPP